MKRCKRYSGQRFVYDLNIAFKLLDILADSSIEEKSNINLADYLKMGAPKVQAFMNYIEICDLIDNRQLTDFGTYILKFKEYPEIYQPLLYYKLCRGWENGGHFYYSRVVNNILYDRYFSADNCIDNSEIKEKILDYKYEYVSMDEKLVSIVTKGISSAEGFGYLRILEKESNSRSKYKINSYKPHYLVCAYILYDIWPDNVGTISFDDIIFNEYNLGRIFFLTEKEIIPILSKLHQINLIKIEDKAGLKQIAKNPKISGNEILEEICNEYSIDTVSN